MIDPHTMVFVTRSEAEELRLLRVLAKRYRILRDTAAVDDSFPEVLHMVDEALDEVQKHWAMYGPSTGGGV